MLPRRSARAVVTASLALALPATLATALLLPAHGDDGKKPRREHASYSDVAFRATNDLRRADELTRLKDERCLRKFAREQAKTMAAEEEMRHQDLRPVLRRCDLRLAGENLAYGFPSGEDVVEAWRDSRSHHANLVEPRYEAMAIVSRRSEDGTWYVAQLFGSRD